MHTGKNLRHFCGGRPTASCDHWRQMCGAQNNGIPWTTIPEEEFMGYVWQQEKDAAAGPGEGRA